MSTINGLGRLQEVVLIRHGQSTANVSGVWQGQLEFPLSSLGRLQAADVGRALAGTKISGVYTSPLVRAFETAEIIAREVGFSEEVVPLQGLSERRGGILEGYTWAEQEARNPAFVSKFLALPEEERWTLAGAETDDQILGRFKVAISEVLARHRSAEGALVVVTHGGVMRAYLRDLFGPTVLPDSDRAPNASITRLRFHPGSANASPELLELASTGHLLDERRTSPEAPDATRPREQE